MKRWMRVLFVLAMLVLTCMNMVIPALAAESAKLGMPVKIKISGTKPKTDEEYQIVLKAEDSSSPMPTGTVNGQYTLTVTGAATAKLPSMAFDQVGTYSYTIRQKAGSKKNCTYDDTVYTMKVVVTNNEDYTGFVLTVVLDTDKTTEKAEEVVFTNKYKAESTSVKTGDDSNPVLYAGLVFVGLAMFLVLFLTRRKKEYED